MTQKQQHHDVIPRSDWTSRVPSWDSMAEPVDDIYVHHSVSHAGPSMSLKAAHLRDLEAFHVEKRGMRAIAYSFLIFPDGSIFAGRGFGHAGGHTEDHNSTSYGICFIGDFTHDTLSEKAVEAFQWLVHKRMKKQKHVTKSVAILPHRAVQQTACPGEEVMKRLPDLRREP